MMDHLTHSFLSSAVSALLAQRGIVMDEATLLCRMEAPYLFLKRDDRYCAGRTLLTPDWLNLALHPMGLTLHTQSLPKEALLPYLQAHAPLILADAHSCWLFIASVQGRRIHVAGPHTERIVASALLFRQLPETVTAITLKECPPMASDVIPLLLESLHTLDDYRHAVMALFPRIVTREDMAALHPQYFRALMTDLIPLLPLYQDEALSQEVKELHRKYRTLLLPGEHNVLLHRHLSRQSINRCITWLQELIRDRLYQLGVPDEMVFPS